MLLQNLCHRSIINNNLRLLLGSFDRVLSLEYGGQFLERSRARLNEEEINHNKLQRIRENKEKVILPSGARECDFGDKCVIEAGDVDEELGTSEKPKAQKREQRSHCTSPSPSRETRSANTRPDTWPGSESSRPSMRSRR